MRGARQTILVKAEQMQRMNRQFLHGQVMDAVSIEHFSESLVYDYFRLLK
ncbi:hypothetical protein KY363_04970 [Candidatus Woesearchaeota archaeon]|nr:hypothetical protein [Candidatus Woesearchaeota archaeon]